MDGAETAPALTWQMRAPIMRGLQAIGSTARRGHGRGHAWWGAHACANGAGRGPCHVKSLAANGMPVLDPSGNAVPLDHKGGFTFTVLLCDPASLQDPTILCRSVDGQAGGAGHWHREEAQPIETVSMSLPSAPRHYHEPASTQNTACHSTYRLCLMSLLGSQAHYNLKHTR